MPELPEVETIRRGLSKMIVGKIITKVVIKKPNLVKQAQASFCRNLINSKFTKTDRIGKLLIFTVVRSQIKADCTQANAEVYLLMHLKMTGQLVYCDADSFVAGGHANSKKEEEQFQSGKTEEFCQPGKYTHIIFELEDNEGKISKLFFNDLRQFGTLKVVDEKELKEIKSKYGIEPGQPNFTFKNFQKALGVNKGNKKPRRANVKATLLNQAIISGLGNIYVDEALFAAKIHPQRTVDTVTEVEQKLLFNSVKRIIKLALKYNGTTFSDFIDSKGKKGNFKQMLKVYGREGEKCKKPRCNGEIQKIKKVAGRGTRFCPKCQKV